MRPKNNGGYLWQMICSQDWCWNAELELKIKQFYVPVSGRQDIPVGSCLLSRWWTLPQRFGSSFCVKRIRHFFTKFSFQFQELNLKVLKEYYHREGRVNKCLFLLLIPVNSWEEVLSTFFMYHCVVIGGNGGDCPHFLCLPVGDKKYNVGW